MFACVCACVRVCVRVCVRMSVCVHSCVLTYTVCVSVHVPSLSGICAVITDDAVAAGKSIIFNPRTSRRRSIRATGAG